ncbi:YciI family protein [Chloroflexota bacterium]
MEERQLFVNLRTMIPGTEKVRETHLVQHRASLANLEKSGKLLMHGRFADGSGALMIFNTSSVEEAKALVGQDPFSIFGACKDDIKAWNCRLIKVNLGPS